MLYNVYTYCCNSYTCAHRGPPTIVPCLEVVCFSRVHVSHLEPPTSIYGKEFGWVQHASDLARIQVKTIIGVACLEDSTHSLVI